MKSQEGLLPLDCTDDSSVSGRRTSMKITTGILDLSDDVRTFVSATTSHFGRYPSDSEFLGERYPSGNIDFPSKHASQMSLLDQRQQILRERHNRS